MQKPGNLQKPVVTGGLRKAIIEKADKLQKKFPDMDVRAHLNVPKPKGDDGKRAEFTDEQLAAYRREQGRF